MVRKLLGRKRGMTTMFDDKGNVIPCTVIECEKNIVTQIKNKESDGYTAVQSSFELVTAKDSRKKEARTTKPMRGHFAKSEVEPRKHLVESRVENLDGIELGQEFGVEMFAAGDVVDVMGTSKGKGFQGVMKLHNYSGGPASHGSKFHRRRGSQGMRSTPGRCFPGDKRPGRMGFNRTTVQNLQVVQVIEDQNIIIVRGAVPGATDGLVCITSAVKKGTAKAA